MLIKSNPSIWASSYRSPSSKCFTASHDRKTGFVMSIWRSFKQHSNTLIMKSTVGAFISDNRTGTFNVLRHSYISSSDNFLPSSIIPTRNFSLTQDNQRTVTKKL
ncbi:hypothetical protein X975_18618, partial [Stegodyphus mimosarum]